HSCGSSPAATNRATTQHYSNPTDTNSTTRTTNTKHKKPRGLCSTNGRSRSSNTPGATPAEDGSTHTRSSCSPLVAHTSSSTPPAGRSSATGAATSSALVSPTRSWTTSKK